VLVANVVNGPDNALNEDWKSTIARATGSGKRVIGYVRTGYLGVSQQRFTTRLGSNDLADWVAQIQTDVETWYNLYGNAIGGIFFDEGWNDCGPNNVYAELYRYINHWTKTRHPDAYTVLNPGATMPQVSCLIYLPSSRSRLEDDTKDIDAAASCQPQRGSHIIH